MKKDNNRYSHDEKLEYYTSKVAKNSDLYDVCKSIGFLSADGILKSNVKASLKAGYDSGIKSKHEEKFANYNKEHYLFDVIYSGRKWLEKFTKTKFCAIFFIDTHECFTAYFKNYSELMTLIRSLQQQNNKRKKYDVYAYDSEVHLRNDFAKKLDNKGSHPIKK